MRQDNGSLSCERINKANYDLIKENDSLRKNVVEYTNKSLFSYASYISNNSKALYIKKITKKILSSDRISNDKSSQEFRESKFSKRNNDEEIKILNKHVDNNKNALLQENFYLKKDFNSITDSENNKIKDSIENIVYDCIQESEEYNKSFINKKEIKSSGYNIKIQSDDF